jgi:sacsin
LTWTNLNCCSKTIGLLDGISPVPEIGNVQFVSAAWSSSSSQLLQNLALGECLGSTRLIQDHIVPAWESEKARTWTSSCKEQLASFVLSRFSLLSLEVQGRLRTIPMIPVSQLNGKQTPRFARAAELIDPSVPELEGLCFDDEEIRPKASFLRKFNAALKGCGLKTAVDESVVEHRIRCYANAKYPLQEIQKRAQKLLKSACLWTTLPENQVGSNLQRLKWLPVVDLTDSLSLKASGECRGRKDRLLVDSQLPILDVSISTEWEKRLGWHRILPGHILLSQLEIGVQGEDREVIDAVLTYISQNGLTETLANSLTKIPCTLVRSGRFVRPSHAFRPPTGSIAGCERLEPYLANIDNKFWQDHKDLLTKLKVGDQLQPSDLLKIQATLESKVVLEDSDIAVAIEIVNLASKFPRASLAGLKVISGTGVFYPLEDINYDDLGPLKSKDKVNLTHPDIPRRIIHRLGIGSLRERLIKGMLEIEDVDDEDEFDQRENVTTRIADTLDRYPVETTFREYLANADDTEGASHISWLLDERVHPTGKLLTPEMKIFQGPAFLIHNDGGESSLTFDLHFTDKYYPVFSDDDFKGFKNVGEGSKAHDKSTIGQFGRGSQTMYHWTDVPMILSGRYLLILE